MSHNIYSHFDKKVDFSGRPVFIELTALLATFLTPVPLKSLFVMGTVSFKSCSFSEACHSSILSRCAVMVVLNLDMIDEHCLCMCACVMWMQRESEYCTGLGVCSCCARQSPPCTAGRHYSPRPLR